MGCACLNYGTKTLPSYIKDSQLYHHTLWYLSSKLRHHKLRTASTQLNFFATLIFLAKNKLLFVMDITSLHTVIPNDEGLRAL